MRPRQLICMLAAVAALGLAACGSDEEPRGAKLPPSVSDTLLTQLDSIGDRVAANVSGACDDIFEPEAEGGNIEPIEAALESIPARVDPEIRTALEQSVERLERLVNEECDEIRAAEQSEQDTATEELPPVETVTEETETTPPETTDTAPPETETTQTTPEAPPQAPPTESPGGNGVGPDGQGPPGQDRGGAEAPDEGDG